MKCLANNRSYKKAKLENLSTTVRFFAIVFCYVLADKYGFGERKLKQILKTVTTLAEEISDNEIKLEELNSVLNEEYDIIIN